MFHPGRPAALRPTPVGFPRPAPPPSFPLPPVEDDLDALVPDDMPQQALPEIAMFSGDDDEVWRLFPIRLQLEQLVPVHETLRLAFRVISEHDAAPISSAHRDRVRPLSVVLRLYSQDQVLRLAAGPDGKTFLREAYHSRGARSIRGWRFLGACLATALAALAAWGGAGPLLSAGAGTTPATPPDVRATALAPLRTLRPGHPRLIGLPGDLQRVREMIGREPLARAWRDQLRQEADRWLGEPPVERVLVGSRMLAQSRRALERVYTLGLLYRLDGDQRLAQRARAELLAASAFSDWNPSHFLDVAEMAHALAIGYDWLYEFLEAGDKRLVRRAIVEKGLRPSLDLYRQQRGWVLATHNWNQVCNGGMVMAALAMADEEPELAASIIGHAVGSVRRPLARYAPDGGWDEGPGYWNYGTSYTVYLLAALESALGTDFGLGRAAGLAETGLFRLSFMGPTGLAFNFADAPEREAAAPQLFWLARRFDRPLYAWTERQLRRRPTALDLLWFDPRGSGPKAEGLPPDALFRGIHVAFLRSAWEDPNALFVGFKGGDNRANHSHLDLGTFVLDGEGQRWAVDLGADDYNLPGYFSKPRRFTYYRPGTEGHNTLTFDGANQRPEAQAPIVAFASRAERAIAIADLTAGYAGQAARVRRGIARLDQRHVLVQDEVEGASGRQMTWAMHTRAAIAVDGPRATLRRGDAYLHARILEPAGARFDVAPATPAPPQAQDPEVQRLVVTLPISASSTRLAVLLSPSRSPDGPRDFPRIVPLSEW